MWRKVHHNIPKPKLGHQAGSIGTGSRVYVGKMSRRSQGSRIRRRRNPPGLYWGKAPKPRW